MTDINTTGPTYPHPPAAGANALGVLNIGVDPVGDISSFDFWSTICSQYANAPIMTGMLQRFLAAMDPTALFDTWYDDVWNIQTAKDYGLDIWGRIVGVNRVLLIPTVAYFGFHEALPSSLTWNTGVSLFNGSWVETDVNQAGGSFYAGGGLTSNYRLETESYRRLIMAKAAQNITGASIPQINQILLNLFPNRGNAYVTDGYQGGAYFGFNESTTALTFGEGIFYSGASTQNMVMTYTFMFPLTSVEIAIVTQSGVLPRPTGVHASVVVQGVTVVP
jgi:hypothetical protein